MLFIECTYILEYSPKNEVDQANSFRDMSGFSSPKRLGRSTRNFRPIYYLDTYILLGNDRGNKIFGNKCDF